MRTISKLAALTALLALVLLTACGNNGADPNIPEDAPTNPGEEVIDNTDYSNYPGNFRPEQDNTVQFHANIDDLFAQYFKIRIAQDPQLVTSMRYPEGEAPRQEDKLNPVSFGYQAWQNELARNTLAVLEQYPEADLTPEQRVNKDILQWALELDVDGDEFLYHDVLVLNKLMELTVFMVLDHEIATVEDAENYLARLEQFPVVLEQIRVNLEIQEKKGLIPPKTVLDSAYQKTNSDAKMMEEDFINRAAGLPEKDALILRCRQIINDAVNPAYSKLRLQIGSMQSEAVNNVSELPNGKEYYSWLLRSYTTTDMSPDVMHQLCQDEVTRLQDELKSVLDSLGYNGSNYTKVISDLSADTIPQDQVIAYYGAIIDDAEDLLPQLFGRMPKTPVAIQPSVVRTGYEIPTRDGALPGIFLLNPAFPQPKLGANWFVWHETIPGHHMQFAIEHEADIPYFRDFLFLTGYLEGWGTYGEMLPFELKLVDDPASYALSLNRYLMLAARVVVDTGINFMGWSEQEGKTYLRDVTGLNPDYYVPDLISRPGRSAGYYVGMLKIRELREKVKSKLGDAYDVREFHDLVLEHGSMPLDVLEDLVDEYILENK